MFLKINLNYALEVGKGYLNVKIEEMKMNTFLIVFITLYFVFYDLGIKIQETR